MSIEKLFILGFCLIGGAISVVAIANLPSTPLESEEPKHIEVTEVENEPPEIPVEPVRPASSSTKTKMVSMTGIEDEKKRREIFWEIYVGLSAAEYEAERQGVDLENYEASKAVDDAYMKAIEERFKIDKYQLTYIQVEGINKDWPRKPLKY